MDTNWVVLKFGGTSVAAAENWKTIAEHCAQVSASGHSVMLVVSAIRGVTDRLSAHSDPDEAALLLSDIDARYRQLLSACSCNPEQAYQDLVNELLALLVLPAEQLAQPAHRASLLSMGERLSSVCGQQILMQAGIACHLQDARQLLRCEQAAGGGRRDYESARCDYTPDTALAGRIHGQFAASAGQPLVCITQGFMASNNDGETVLLGRGGSDTSAACIAARLAAVRLEIWSDVAGMFTADPRTVSGTRLLKHLSYLEAQELASMGARVLHPRCIEPLRTHEIPLYLKQTSRPELPGTVVSVDARDYRAQIKAIVSRSNITLISMEGLTMWHQVGFLADAFACFRDHGLSVDLISSSEANVTVSLDMDAHLLDSQVLADLKTDLERICRVSIRSGCASVSLVGLDIRTIIHRLGPALEVFEQRHMHMVSLASNDLNLSFVVDDKDAVKLVQQLHQQLIPGGVGGDSVFGPTWEQIHQNRMEASAEPAWWQNAREQLLNAEFNGTALYAYHLPTCRQAARRLASLSEVDRVFYAIKANSGPEILNCIADEGLGLECVSMAEVRHVLSTTSISPHRILFTPNFAPREEYRQAIEAGVILTLDNLYILEQWGHELAGQSVMLRVDPGSGLGHHKLVRTAGSHSKFGVPPEDFDDVLDAMKRHDIRVIGLHAHIGSGVLHADAWHRTARTLASYLDRFPDARSIDIGGGLGVPDRQDQNPFDLARLDEGLSEIRAGIDREIEIWLEPGRYLVAESGVLLARVTQSKGKGDVRYVGVETGMNSLIRPALYGAYHEIHNLTRIDEAPVQICNVVGPVCETGDILGLDRLLPDCREGDVLLIANTGAYGEVMSSDYNMRPRAQAWFIDS